MANIKELRGRIRSVTGIAQLTKAMEMVASMKLRKVQGKAQASRPFASEIRALIEHLDEHVGPDADIPLFRRRKVMTTGILLITSDRGLCGSYNANVLSRFHEFEDEIKAAHPERKLKIFCYGRKGYSYLTRRGYDVARYFVDPPLDKADYRTVRLVGEALMEAFEDGTVDEVRLCYTHFASVARFEPRLDAFLPVTTLPVGEAAKGSPKGDVEYLLEPDPVTIFNRLVPKYLEIAIWDAMLQSLASEYAARRMAMKGATDAASRMRKDLRRIYNRARQEGITKELLDIIGGANAVA
jgi:F-type H+-transporting ATPase subunit gamma